MKRMENWNEREQLNRGNEESVERGEMSSGRNTGNLSVYSVHVDPPYRTMLTHLGFVRPVC